MAGSLSDVLENELLDHTFGAATYTPPVTLYVSAHTGSPGDDDSGANEVPSSNNYARVAVTNNATNFPAAVAGAKSNGTAITFPTASGSWGTITHIGIYDAATNGNLLAHADLAVSKDIDASDVLQIPIGDFDFTLA